MKLGSDRFQVLAGGHGVRERLVIDRRRDWDRHRFDDRAVAAQRNIAVLAPVADHDRLGVHRSEPRRQSRREMTIHCRVARHGYRYSQYDGMGQVTINSQCLPLNICESALAAGGSPEDRATLTDLRGARQPRVDGRGHT